MASTCVALILIFTSIFQITIAAQQQNHRLKSRIMLGSSLSPSKLPSWNSSSSRFQFGFYKQGTGFSLGIWLLTSPNITVVWTANRDEPSVSSNAKLTLTEDGLLLETDEIKKIVNADTLSQPISFASMLDSGNFVLYSHTSAIIWSSFEFPTDTILEGQNLKMGQNLSSSLTEANTSTGRFFLNMQIDGNLVLYPAKNLPWRSEFYWASNNYATEKLNLSPGGVLQLMSGNKTLKVLARSSYSIKSMNETVKYRAKLDSDGILKLYSHHFNNNGSYHEYIEWSILQNQCLVKGVCGLNSFCSTSNNNGTKGHCYCFPGFDFINPERKFMGCYRNFTDEEGCKRKMPAKFYNVTGLENTKLGGFAYAKLSVSKEGCSKSCLNDCYCGAAFYSDRTCSKYKLPLMFAMKDQNMSATLFIKWSSGQESHITTDPIPPRNEYVDADHRKKIIIVVAACLGSITFLCFLIAISSFLVYKRRLNRYQRLRGKNSNMGPAQEFILQSFSFNELERATNGFQDVLGRGRFGAVYKGSIPEGNYKLIAVKSLENPVEEGERKFQTEMGAVRRTHHKNIVRLLGFCILSSKKLLVYEFMSKGSLENLFFNVESGLLWRDGLRIALDVARGLLYLHEECEVQIIHCNINLQNILLDDSSTAKISNFSLAKILMPNQTGIVAGVKGSRGYMSPEWQNSGLITVKADVYSFGVVLLKIVCCRSNLEVNISAADEVLLSNWVYNCFVANELDKLVGEEEEEEEADMRTLERMVKVGLLCIDYEPNLRPSMKNVILMLEGTMEIPVVPTISRGS